ncbi:MAG: U32 family peptidase [Deltaproteobacteria bacterium]|nr:U32 family peptidase [Deltaproteobacteria bacterium]MBW2151149.1 U32 family peptidase [Deltaproteobacteria bacterium]
MRADSLQPSILAPAGNRESFLAALAAGAEAIYCGLKKHSARMGAQNFTIAELTTLIPLAHEKGAKVFITVNTMMIPAELDEVGDLIKRLNRFARPDALIIQDLALISVARQADFTGDLVLSTLANVSFPEALPVVRNKLGVKAVVVPRELCIDEVRAMARGCPEGLELEIFVHGALCYGISGRCYWSSYLGGKSGLRGRCVQPCRRVYRQENREARSFSCQDLSLDVLVKVLLNIPQISGWKIEGRKKGPHYVFYTVKAYQMLRDHGTDPQAKKEALLLLEQSLGRKTTHYRFLPQRPQNPVSDDDQTASGLLVGKTEGGGRKTFISPKLNLMRGDVLRIGYEDQRWHHICKVNRYVPKNGHYYLDPSIHCSAPKGTSVFLIDRREGALEEMIRNLEKELGNVPLLPKVRGAFQAKLSWRPTKRKSIKEITVYRSLDQTGAKNRIGLWLSAETLPEQAATDIWWWLPPVIWPEEIEELKAQIEEVLKKGAHSFVLNAPWQICFFEKSPRLALWAGPFCNIANALAIEALSSLGFTGVIVSPELGGEDYLKLPKQSPLPLGIVVSGNWPLCVARTLSRKIKTNIPFTSPKGELAWVSEHGSTFWLYPNWPIDLTDKRQQLKSAGYSLFVNLRQPVPRTVNMKKRQGLWNWKIGLK